jgi:hypothetical protein
MKKTKRTMANTRTMATTMMTMIAQTGNPPQYWLYTQSPETESVNEHPQEIDFLYSERQLA